jgi:CrcB protein
MDKLFLVAAGGAVGAVARYLAGIGATRALGGGWPYGTLAVNVIGGFAMGLLAASLALRGGGDQERWRLLLGVGVLGGFTTFSAFSLEVALMIERRQLPQAFGYSLLSVVLSVAALFAGLMLARRVLAA